jgi:hypothetical protein
MDIKINTSSARTMLLELSKAATPALVRALNKTLTGVRTDKSTVIREDLNLSKRYVDQQIAITRASNTRPEGRVTTRSKPVGLINFTGTRQVTKGVSVKVKKYGTRSILKHAFIATANNAQNVFWRARIGGKLVARLPIERLTGPRLTDNLSRPEVIAEVEKKAGARLDTNLAHEIDYEISRLK